MKNETIAFFAGAALGAALALLFAPDKGEVTRGRIKEAVDDGMDKIKDVVDGSVSKCREIEDRVKKYVKTYGKEAESEVGAILNE